MIIKKIAAIGVLTLVAPVSAFAEMPVNKETGFYAELGIIQAYYKEPIVNLYAQTGSTLYLLNAPVVARAGYNINKSASNMYISVRQSGSDFSYGVGAQHNFTKNTYGQVDYMSFYNKNDIWDGQAINGPSISVGYRL